MKEWIRICDLEKYYGSSGTMTKAIDRISFTIEKGEFLGIMGSSGSGKTSLLNLIATIDTPTSGHIYFDEMDLTQMNEEQKAKFRKENLGFIFQNFNLLDTMTLQENIAMPLILNGNVKKDTLVKIENIMKELGIQEIGHKYPAQTSGGQQQRCACARAMINDPKLILADEPTGALDVHNAEEFMRLLTNLKAEHQTTILMVTHDPVTASYCDRILFLKDGKLVYELHRGARTQEDFLDSIALAQGIS